MAQPGQSPSDRPVEPAAPREEAVRGQLARILASDHFARADRVRSLLLFIVDETLAGRTDELRETTIASEAFALGEAFDPGTSMVVRVEAGRLRRRLERYYLTNGQHDAVRIDLPKSGYVPLFRALGGADDAAPPEPDDGSVSRDVALEIPKGPSIAVMPFQNLSGDPGQAFFVDGITEEVVNNLTRFPDLRVISRHSTLRYQDDRADVRDLGKNLGVGHILEGSVRKAGDVVRISCQLVNAADGAHLFSETYDRDLSSQSILEIQDDIADRIVAAVGQPYGIIARVGTRLAKRKAWQHLDAYEAVLRFYEYWLNGSPEMHGLVREALERAVELDPTYASAWAGLASVHLDEVRFSYNPRPEADALDRALEAAQRAVQLDPENSMAYHFLFSAHFHRGELDEFRATGERALALNPNHADMLADYGIMLAFTGEWERGVGLTRKAVALSPTHPGWFHTAAVVDHYRKGDYKSALASAKLAHVPLLFSSHMMLAMCYGQLGRDAEGRTACDRLLELAPDITERVRDTLAAWNLADDIIDHAVDGLRKAGLTIPDRAE